MAGEYVYSEYWERCWNSENVDDLMQYLSGWNGFKSEEIDIFKSQGVNHVCDVACGFGAHTLALLSNGFNVEAFDVSPRAVELTTAGLKEYGYENVKVKIASVLDTGYDDASFDAVTAYAVMDHLTKKDLEKAIRELMRIVKEEGLVLISFDQPQDEDFIIPHRLLEDGSMLYEEGTSNEGMIFHPYEDDEISDLMNEHRVLFHKTNQKGDKIYILKK